MSSTDCFLALPAVYYSYQSLKKPRNAVLQHWVIFWLVLFCLHWIDLFVNTCYPLVSWIPLVNLVYSVYNLARIVFILANYNTRVTYITYRTGLKFGYQEGLRFYKRLTKYLDLDSFSAMIPQCAIYLSLVMSSGCKLIGLESMITQQLSGNKLLPTPRIRLKEE